MILVVFIAFNRTYFTKQKSFVILVVNSEQIVLVNIFFSLFYNNILASDNSFMVMLENSIDKSFLKVHNVLIMRQMADFIYLQVI